MSVSVICRGCGSRVRLPDGINPHKARCSKCRTGLDPDAPITPDAFPSVPEEGRPGAGANGRHPGAPARLAAGPPPPGEVLSLDDDGPELIGDELKPDSAPNPAHPATPEKTLNPRPKPARPPGVSHQLPPPPFRFAVQVVADSRNQLGGMLAAVLTPHGLFLEAVPNKPLVSAPVGTTAVAAGPIVVLTLPGRVVTLRFRGVGVPDQLAADTAGFLAGGRPVPLPVDYRRPWWLLGVGAALALGLAAGPVVLAEVADLGLGAGVLFGAVFAVLAMAANAGIALLPRLGVAAKVGLMAGMGVAVLAVFLFGATAYLAGRGQQAEQAGETTPPPEPRPDPPAGPGPPSPPPAEPRRPSSHVDIAYRDGKTRLDDGPADVTALAVSPTDGAVVIGYADGSTRIWPLDQPAFEPPRVGPRATSAVRRIEFDAGGRFAFMTCDTGLVVGSPDAPRRPPLVIPGELATVFTDGRGTRFAALRAGRVQVRYVPYELVEHPPAARAAKGFVLTVPRDETTPAGQREFTPLGSKTTFLAWHPTGRLLGGGPDGSVVTLPTPGLSAVASREHKAAVRAWAVSPWGDFATGDDDGYVGYWPNKAVAPTKFRTGEVAVRHLAYSPCGGELAVADAVGALAVWHPASGTRVFEVKRRAAVEAVAYGPHDDLLMVADGKGVEVWWIPERAAQGGNR
ncbi:MAG: hypothetical protein JWO38_5843 [Gemmataceae bacterium]|nr:hypothetical protein [Gemmataceae bacterium]